MTDAKLALLCGRMYDTAASNFDIAALNELAEPPLTVETVVYDSEEGFATVLVGVEVASTGLSTAITPVSIEQVESAKRTLAEVDDSTWKAIQGAFSNSEDVFESPETVGPWLVSTGAGLEGTLVFGKEGTPEQAGDSQWFGPSAYDRKPDTPGVFGEYCGGVCNRVEVVVRAPEGDGRFYLVANAPLDGHNWPPIPDLEALLKMLSADLTEDGFRGARPGMRLTEVVELLGTPTFASIDRPSQQSVDYKAPLHHPEIGSRDHMYFEVSFIAYHREPVAQVFIKIRYYGHGEGAPYYRGFLDDLRGLLTQRFEASGPDEWTSTSGRITINDEITGELNLFYG